MTGETVVLAVLAATTAINTYYDRKGKKEAAAKVSEVKDVLQVSTQKSQRQMENLQHTADDTHTLVNNNMAIQLNMLAISARTLANLTKTKEHKRLAVQAEAALKDHMDKQAQVDKAVKDRKGETS